MDEDLEYLVKAYFHEDWQIEGPTAKAVLERFAANNPRETILGARNAAIEILNQTSDSDLNAVLEKLGLHYDPEYEGLTDRQWLQLVADTLSVFLEHDPGSVSS